MAHIRTPDPKRRNGVIRHRVLAVAVAAIVTTWAGAAHAMCSSSVDPSYLEGVADDPKSLLRQNPSGGDPLTFKIRQLAVHGTRILKAIGTIVSQANSQQKDAIGKGLAHAGGACSARSPEIARQITELVRASGDHDVIRAYTRFFSTTEDTPSNSSTTSAIGAQQDLGGRMPNLNSGFAPRALPLGDPFAKP